MRIMRSDWTKGLVGKRVKLIRCSDEYTKLKPGELGTINFVDDIGTVFVKWDCGSSLGMIDGVDQWQLVEEG